MSGQSLLLLTVMLLQQKDTVDSYQPSPTTSIHSSSATALTYNITFNVQTLPAQSNIMPTVTSLTLYNLPTSTTEGTKSLPSVQPSSTNRVLIGNTDETLQLTPQSSRPQSSRPPRPRNSESFQSTLHIHSTTSAFALHTEPSSVSNAPTAGSPFITLDLQTIAMIAGAAAFVATFCLVVTILSIIACKCNKSRQRHNNNMKRAESMLGNAAYGTTVQHSAAAIRTYRPGDTYDYPRFGLQLLKTVNKGRGLEVHNGADIRRDNAYTSVSTFTAAQNSEAHVTSPTTGSEDFEDNMQTNEAYVATPTSTTGFEHSMQINEAYAATPTSVIGGLEHSMQQRDSETYENYVTNTSELDEYSYVRYVYR